MPQIGACQACRFATFHLRPSRPRPHAPEPRRLSKPRPLAPETPWSTGARSFIDQPFRIRVQVVVEDDEIRTTHRLTRTRKPTIRQLHRLMTNLRGRPLPRRIATTQIRDLQLTLALRRDLVEQLDLVRRRTVCQH